MNDRPWEKQGGYGEGWTWVVAGLQEPYTIHAIKNIDYRRPWETGAVSTVCNIKDVLPTQLVRRELLGSDVGVACKECWEVDDE